MTFDSEIPRLSRGSLLAGEIERYRLLGILGESETAQLLLAREQDRWVVFKRPRGAVLRTREEGAVFLAEVRRLAGLEHDNACPIIDAGSASDGPYLVSPHLHGETVRAVFIELQSKSVKSRVELAAYIAAACCDVLEYAYFSTGADRRPLGIVHGNLRSKKVMITYSGAVKVLDLGLEAALSLDRRALAAQPADAGHLSPERARGGKPSHPADLFSLGVMMWEAVAGRALVRARDVRSALEMIRESRFMPLREVVPDVPADFAAITSRALAPDPADRYPTAFELARDLRRFLAAQGSTLAAGELSRLMRDHFPERAADHDPTSRIVAPLPEAPTTRLPAGGPPPAVASLRPAPQSAIYPAPPVGHAPPKESWLPEPDEPPPPRHSRLAAPASPPPRQSWLPEPEPPLDPSWIAEPQPWSASPASSAPARRSWNPEPWQAELPPSVTPVPEAEQSGWHPRPFATSTRPPVSRAPSVIPEPEAPAWTHDPSAPHSTWTGGARSAPPPPARSSWQPQALERRSSAPPPVAQRALPPPRYPSVPFTPDDDPRGRALPPIDAIRRSAPPPGALPLAAPAGHVLPEPSRAMVPFGPSALESTGDRELFEDFQRLDAIVSREETSPPRRPSAPPLAEEPVDLSSFRPWWRSMHVGLGLSFMVAAVVLIGLAQRTTTPGDEETEARPATEVSALAPEAARSELDPAERARVEAMALVPASAGVSAPPQRMQDTTDAGVAPAPDAGTGGPEGPPEPGSTLPVAALKPMVPEPPSAALAAATPLGSPPVKLTAASHGRPAIVPEEDDFDRLEAEGKALLERALMAARTGDAMTAERSFRNCVRRTDLPECHRELGAYLASHGKPAEGAQELRRYLALLPDAEDAIAIEQRIAELEGE